MPFLILHGPLLLSESSVKRFETRLNNVPWFGVVLTDTVVRGRRGVLQVETTSGAASIATTLSAHVRHPHPPLRLLIALRTAYTSGNITSEVQPLLPRLEMMQLPKRWIRFVA